MRDSESRFESKFRRFRYFAIPHALFIRARHVLRTLLRTPITTFETINFVPPTEAVPDKARDGKSFHRKRYVCFSFSQKVAVKSVASLILLFYTRDPRNPSNFYNL